MPQSVCVALILLAGCGGPAVRSGTVPVERGSLYYEEAGDSAGRAVVLIHGGFGDRRMWDDQFRALARRYRVIRYDHRGFGRSPAPDSAYSPVADLATLLDARGIRRADLVGNSMGGTLALDFALVHPKRVRSLVIVASGPNGLTAPKEDIDAVLAVFRLASTAGDSAAAARWLEHPMVAVAMSDPAVAPRLHLMVMENRAMFRLPAWPSEPLDPPAAGRLRGIGARTLVVMGDHDTPLVQSYARYTARGIPGAQLVTLEGADHLPQMEQPAEFSRLVRAFLERPERSARPLVFDGDTVWVESTGGGEGPAVLFLNGGAMGFEQWDGIAEALGEGFRTIRYDGRGWGRSPLPRSPYSPADDVIRVLDTLRVDRAVLVGSSSGGSTAIDVALAHPSRVAGMMLVAPALGGFQWSSSFLERGARFANATDSLRAELLLDDPHFVPAVREDRRLADQVRGWLGAGAHAMRIDGALVQGLDPPAIARLGELRVPVLLVRPERDHPDLHQVADTLAARVAGAQVARLAGAGHLAHLERPEELGALLRRFLAGR